jgi:hypothetical protein
MKPAMQNIFGDSKQRGFRLRCFLSMMNKGEGYGL